MGSPPPGLETLLARLAASGTEFVVVGALAAVAPRMHLWLAGRERRRSGIREGTNRGLSVPITPGEGLGLGAGGRWGQTQIAYTRSPGS